MSQPQPTIINDTQTTETIYRALITHNDGHRYLGYWYNEDTARAEFAERYTPIYPEAQLVCITNITSQTITLI